MEPFTFPINRQPDHIVASQRVKPDPARVAHRRMIESYHESRLFRDQFDYLK